MRFLQDMQTKELAKVTVTNNTDSEKRVFVYS
jgi:hypothetical protein